MSSGFKSTMRALHQLERAAEQRRRAAIKQYKIQEKQQAIQNAAEAVRQYDEFVKTLLSVHKVSMQPVNWQELDSAPEPIPPVRTSPKEEAAIRKRKAYTPSFFDKLFKMEAKQQKKLDKKIVEARKMDDVSFSEQLKKHDSEFADWKESKEMAKGVLQKDIQTYKRVLDYFTPFSEIAELGTKLNLNILPDNASVDLFVNSVEVIPREILSQTSTGKLSKKAMATGRFNELYQDFVCSCVLRVARELFACLPLQLVVVNAVANVLDTSTGISSEQPILSVAFTPEKLQGLNFDALDPSDSMTNFAYRMKFGKTTGFSGVEKIDPVTLIST